jgi:ABC-2 type transport system ATP-binding protein
MMEYAIETNNLSKIYGEVQAVSSVNLRVKRGEIYGFLGLNGAGKTTTIRALLGMIRPSAGDVKVLGKPVGPGGRGPWSQVGYLVESPSAYPELTVRENLEIARRLHRIADSRATTRVIKQLGIQPYADRKAGALSTGNLQRLGLARALLHEPELVILDEPANGLDPAGVVEIRELLASLAREKGVTIFMSSHILTEVDRLATRIGIIHAGKLIEELDTNALENLRTKRLGVRARDLKTAQVCLQSAGYQLTFSDGTIFVQDTNAIEHPEEIARLMTNAGVPPTHLIIEHQELEDHFLQLTGGTK